TCALPIYPAGAVADEGDGDDVVGAVRGAAGDELGNVHGKLLARLDLRVDDDRAHDDPFAVRLEEVAGEVRDRSLGERAARVRRRVFRVRVSPRPGAPRRDRLPAV